MKRAAQPIRHFYAVTTSATAWVVASRGSLITAMGYSSMWIIVSLACVVSVFIYAVWARHSDTSFSKNLASH